MRQPGWGGGDGQARTIAGANRDVVDPQLVRYLLANQGDARFVMATPTSTYASVFMLTTDLPALAAWVQSNCTAVAATTWQTTSGGGTAADSGQQRYDCAAVGDR